MLANRVNFFTESVIREMTRLANQHGAINLAQGMSDFEIMQKLKTRGRVRLRGSV